LLDVIVVGGGPAGSYVAGKVASLGYETVLLEQKERLDRQICCTGIIGQECVRSFNFDENIILQRANSAKIFSPSGKLIRLWREKTQAYILDRTAFNLVMAKQAQARGVQYILNSPVQNIEIRDDRIRVEVVHRKERSNFEARVIVIATGFGSKLTNRLALSKTGDFVMGVQVEVSANGVNEVEVYLGQDVAPGFFAWLVPTSSHKALVGLLSRHNPGLHLKKFMKFLETQGKIVTANDSPSYGGIPLQPLTKTYTERLVIVGDAAGQVKPTTGGGIYYSLLCADIAANTLQQALANNALSARNLATYEQAWKRRLRQELRMGYWARKFYERLSDSQIDRIFDIIKSNGIDEALLKVEDLSFDWHSSLVLRLLEHKAISKTSGLIKVPLWLTRGSRNYRGVPL
jgi:geranylgeranyl reductase family protein